MACVLETPAEETLPLRTHWIVLALIHYVRAALYTVAYISAKIYLLQYHHSSTPSNRVPNTVPSRVVLVQVGSFGNYFHTRKIQVLN